jgi:hypothetical protein
VVKRALLLLVACSSSKPRTADDATRAPHAPVVIDAPTVAIDAPPPPPANPDAKTGDVQIRVEWKDVPIPMRASPGKTACHTPRAPVVAPTTTWGVPDVLVVVEGATLPAPAAAPRILLADCALSPRVVAATSAVVESASDKPEKLAFAKRAEIGSLAKLDAGTPRALRLPIAGHEIALPLDANGVYELAIDGETSWVVASTSAGVTEANGALLVRDLAPGAYPVTAWLPPRAGGQAKLAKGTVTVVAGDLAELTLVLK